jgi:ABC-type multidrug transport system fused ATPase/permease subunit
LIGSIGFQLASPQLIRRFIDIARRGGSAEELTQIALIFIAVLLIGQSITAALVYLGAGVSWEATNLLRADLLAHVLRLDMSICISNVASSSW